MQAGGLAGTSVDVALFPLDTLKTRLQSSEGFLKAGGFNGVYRGLGSVVVGSAPGGVLAMVHRDHHMTERVLKLFNIRGGTMT